MGYHLLPVAQSRLSRIALLMVQVAAVILIIAVLVTRSGKTEQLHGVVLAALACILAASGLAVAAVAAVEMWNRGYRGLGTLFQVLFFGALVLGFPAYLTIQAIRLPAINDITTDIEDPPAFSRSRAALLARDGYVPATLEARQRMVQLQAYPAIRPLILDIDAEEAFQTVREAIRALGWKVVEESAPGGRAGQGRIDAIAETRLMRFKDDVTIRIRPQGAETRIDIRSASRIGRHDLGANAARITRLVEEILAQKE